MGAVVYSGIQAELNASVADGVKPVGIMIVISSKVRLMKWCLISTTTLGRQVAIADHTDHRATPEQLHDSDIVVITHEAYTRAKETLSGVKAERWKRLTHWRGGKRLLTIVDGSSGKRRRAQPGKVDDLVPDRAHSARDAADMPPQWKLLRSSAKSMLIQCRYQ